MRSARDGLEALAAELRARDGTAATVLLAEVAGGDELRRPGPAQTAASGPRAGGAAAEYELLIEMIHEGTRLHYGGPRVVGDDDPDLALLLGDQLYALGLARLAELGDLEAVAELADVISLLAQAQAEAEADAEAGGPSADFVQAVWSAGATAIGWGPSPEHEAAKELARASDASAPGALREAAEPRGS